MLKLKNRVLLKKATEQSVAFKLKNCNYFLITICSLNIWFDVFNTTV